MVITYVLGGVANLMAIDDEEAAIRTVIAGVLVGRGNENGRAADALLAAIMRDVAYYLRIC